jgi:hypothetical protein
MSTSAEGVGFEENLHAREAVVDDVVKVYVLHRVLYLQVHANGQRSTFLVSTLRYQTTIDNLVTQMV